MKKFLILIIILLILAFGFLGYTLVSRITTVQPGEYYCDALENGLMTSYPVYTILPDSQLMDIFTGAQGEWRNQPFNKTVTFSGDISIGKAVVMEDSNIFTVTIQPGFVDAYQSQQFIVSADNTLQCYLAYPLGE